MPIYRATPLTNSLPELAELLNGRRYRALLPTRSLIKTALRQIVREQMADDKEGRAEDYSK